MALSARELVLILRATNQASGPIRQVSKDLRSLGSSGAVGGKGLDAVTSARRWQRFGLASAVLRDTGRSARLMGIVAGAGLTFAARGAADFNKAVTLAATQTGKLDMNLGRTTKTIARNGQVIEQGIIKQMQKFPASSDEMAKAAYEIFSSTDLGIRNVAGGMKLLALFNKAAVAGQTDLNEVTQAGISVMQGFHVPLAKMPKILNTAFAAVRFGRMTFNDFTQSLNQLVPAAVSTNQTFETVAGTMAFLTRRMPNVRMAGTSLARLMEIFGRKKFVEGAKEWGVVITDVNGKLKPLPDIIQMLAARIKKMPLKQQADQIRNLIKNLSGTEGTIQARRALNHLLKDALSGTNDYQRILGQTVNDQNEFNRSLKAMEETTGVKWDVLINRLKAFLLLLGASAIPVLEQLLKPLEKIFDSFRKMDKAERDQIARWVAIGATVAIVGGTLASIVGNIGTLIAPFKAFGGSLTVLMAGLTALAALLLVIAGHGELIQKAFDHLFDAATSSTRNMIIALTALGVAFYRLQGAIAGSSMLGMLFGAPGRAGGKAAGIGERWTAQFRKFQGEVKTSTREVAALDAISMASMSRREQAMAQGFGRMRGVERTAMGGARLAEDVVKTSRAATIMRSAMAASAASVAFLPGPLKLAAALTVAAAGAAYLWKRHTDAIAAANKKNAALTQRNLAIATTATTRASQFGGFAGAVEGFDRARLNLAQINANIKQVRAEQSKLVRGSADWVQNELTLRGLMLDRVDAIHQVAAANNAAGNAFAKMELSIRAQNANLATQQRITNEIGRKRTEIARLSQMVTDERGIPTVTRIKDLNTQIGFLQRNLDTLRAGSSRAGQALERAFTNNLKTLQQMGRLPQTTQLQRQDIFKVAQQLGRMPTMKELKLLVKAELDPASAKKLPAAVQRALAAAQKSRPIKIPLAPQFDKNFTKAIGGFIPKVNKIKTAADLPAARRAWNGLKGVFKPIHQNIRVPSLAATGAPGLRSSLDALFSQPIHQQVYVDVHGAYNQARKDGQIHSPSRLFMEGVGEPIGEGISLGMLRGFAKRAPIDMHGIADLSLSLLQGAWLSQRDQWAKTVDLFAGPVIQKLEEKIQDVQSKVEKASATLADKTTKHRKDTIAKAQAALQLKAPGVKAGDLTRDLQAQTMQLHSFNQSISTLARRGVPVQLLSQLRSLGVEGAKYLRLLAGASDKELRKYVAQWKRAQAEIKQASKITMADLQRDLNMQVAELQKFDKAMTTLARRGVPQELLKQLAQMGQEGAQMLAILANASDAQLKRYVAAWQKAQAIIQKFADQEMFNEILQKYKDWYASLFDPMTIIKEVDEARDALKTELTSAFGDLFSGPMNLADKIGSAFKDAHKSWEDNVASLRSQISSAQNDLAKAYDELAAAQVEAVRQRAEELHGYFGELFGGDFLKQKLEWDTVLNMGDLRRDLQEQLDRFKKWRTNINTLIARGVPAALVGQIEKLGPDAMKMLDALVGSSDSDLKDYVALWQESEDNINQVASSAVADTSAILERIADIQQNIADLNQQLNETLAAEPKALTAQDLIDDLSGQIKAFQDWQADLLKLRARNVPEELIAQLRQMGPAAKDYIDALANATDEELAKFVALWVQAGLDIGDAVNNWAKVITPQDILAGMRKQQKDFEQWIGDLGSLVGKVPDELLKQLRDMGPDAAAFIHLLTQMTGPELEEFVNLWKSGQVDITKAAQSEQAKQKADWIQHGHDLAQGFIAALQEEWPNIFGTMQAGFTNIAQNLNLTLPPLWNTLGQNIVQGMLDGWNAKYPTLSQQVLKDVDLLSGNTKDKLGIHSPSKEYEYIGNMMVAGLEKGIKGMSAVTPVPGKPGMAGYSTGGPAVQMTIHAHQDESLQTTLERAAFRMRMRKPA